MRNIAIFASGSGTNAENLIKYFSTEKDFIVSLVLSNKPYAYVINRAEKHSVKTKIFDRSDFYESSRVINILEKNNIDFIVLAGFLWLIPKNILKHYPNQIVNIHPALLPNYGGKGMYGDHVHKAVLDNKESQSGISIHYVNEEYDKGEIILQASCKVSEEETVESLANKIHKLEHAYFPIVVEQLIGE